MGWKGAMRSWEASVRQQEREEKRRQRELKKQHKELEKMQELERAQYEVSVYANNIDLLLSVHKECGKIWDWKTIKSSDPPIKPIRLNANEKLAQDKLTKYKPGIIDKLFKKEGSKRDAFKKAVEESRQLDEKEYQNALQEYEKQCSDWKATIELAEKILNGNTKAYIDAIKKIDPFREISSLGSSLEFKTEKSSLVEASLYVNSEQVIPKEIKSLLKSGKLSIKKMPQGKFNELYQDYVCGCTLRVARELFSLLPVNMVTVTAMANLLNTQTGHIEDQPILSVAIPKETLEKLNFETIDPSDSMSNFIHKMNFKKTSGFNSVEKIKPSDFQSTE